MLVSEALDRAFIIAFGAKRLAFLPAVHHARAGNGNITGKTVLAWLIEIAIDQVTWCQYGPLWTFEA